MKVKSTLKIGYDDYDIPGSMSPSEIEAGVEFLYKIIGDRKKLVLTSTFEPEPAMDDKPEPALLDALNLILPLAKGYAAEHPTGANQDYVTIAEAEIERAKEPK
jgi:hypothetical protein